MNSVTKKSSNHPSVNIQETLRAGHRVRVFDYDPSKSHRPVFAEGSVRAVVSSPLPGFLLDCDMCTYYGRQGTTFAVPFYRDESDFPNRIVVLSENKEVATSV